MFSVSQLLMTQKALQKQTETEKGKEGFFEKREANSRVPVQLEVSKEGLMIFRHELPERDSTRNWKAEDRTGQTYQVFRGHHRRET